MNYSKKLTDPRWQKKRLLILQRDNFTCTKCSDNQSELHIHHLKYSGEPWEADDDKLITVCHHCHKIYELLKSSHEVIDVIDNNATKLIKVRCNSSNEVGVIIYDKELKDTCPLLLTESGLNLLLSVVKYERKQN